LVDDNSLEEHFDDTLVVKSLEKIGLEKPVVDDTSDEDKTTGAIIV